MEVRKERDKRLTKMALNEFNFDDSERDAVKEAINLFGETILTDPYLPYHFNLRKINAEEVAKKFNAQECKMPIEDDLIEELLQMPKISINEVFNFNHRGKSIHGTLLLGKKDGKYVLFLLKIESNCTHKNFSDVSIQLHVCLQGEAWVNLLRLDTSGHTHPNYIVNGKVVKGKIPEARTPHLHKADYLTQVLTDSISYSLAEEIPVFDYETEHVDDKFMFKRLVNYFLDICNANIEINQQVSEDYFYSKTQPLFSYDVPDIYHPEDWDWDGGKN